MRPFHKSRSHYDREKMFGKSMRLVDSAKYLGVVLDKKLYWKEYAEYVTRKFLNRYWTCKRIVVVQWGRKPALLKYLYKAVLVPKLSWRGKTPRATDRQTVCKWYSELMQLLRKDAKTAIAWFTGHNQWSTRRRACRFYKEIIENVKLILWECSAIEGKRSQNT